MEILAIFGVGLGALMILDILVLDGKIFDKTLDAIKRLR